MKKINLVVCGEDTNRDIGIDVAFFNKLMQPAYDSIVSIISSTLNMINIEPETAAREEEDPEFGKTIIEFIRVCNDRVLKLLAAYVQDLNNAFADKDRYLGIIPLTNEENQNYLKTYKAFKNLTSEEDKSDDQQKAIASYYSRIFDGYQIMLFHNNSTWKNMPIASIKYMLTDDLESYNKTVSEMNENGNLLTHTGTPFGLDRSDIIACTHPYMSLTTSQYMAVSQTFDVMSEPWSDVGKNIYKVLIPTYPIKAGVKRIYKMIAYIIHCISLENHSSPANNIQTYLKHFTDTLYYQFDALVGKATEKYGNKRIPDDAVAKMIDEEITEQWRTHIRNYMFAYEIDSAIDVLIHYN